MAITTKIKIFKTGKMEAGQFIEDSNVVSLRPNSDVHVNELDETGDNVKFMSDGTVVANEFVEK